MMYTCVHNIAIVCFQRLSNGDIDSDSDAHRVVELQATLERQSSELTSSRNRSSDLQANVKELEESLATAQKELIKAQEQAVKYQRDLREVSHHWSRPSSISVISER